VRVAAAPLRIRRERSRSRHLIVIFLI